MVDKTRKSQKKLYPVACEETSLLVKDNEKPYLLGSHDLFNYELEPEDTSRYRRNGSREKVLGAVYTPPRVAAALTRWAVRNSEDTVLDPSCGEGVFLSAARTRLADLGSRIPQCMGVDIDPDTASKAGAVCSDFFEWAAKDEKVDVILGNPPFIRSHLFPEKSRDLAFKLMEKQSLHPSRLMSTWAPFLALCCGLLKENGRLAMVVPEELLVVGYARELRQYLLRKFKRVIICFPMSDIFPGVQQSVVLLLCDNNESNRGRGLFTLDFSALEEGNFDALVSAPVWNWTPKWSHLFLSATQRRTVADLVSVIHWKPLNFYGRVEVGIVTGDNKFFILNHQEASRFSEQHLVPIVTSARDLRGIRFNTEDFKRVINDNRPAYLINANVPKSKLNKEELEYISHGEREGISQRYKCRIRDPWYAVPSIWESDAILFRQAGEMPRIVHLTKKCSATDTIHRVTWRQPSQGKRHTVSFFNSWTLLFSELTGRSYGGGVLELMPGEANHLPLPTPDESFDGIFDWVDERIRSRDYYEALQVVDDMVLPPHTTNKDRANIREILLRLINRRKSRS